VHTDRAGRTWTHSVNDPRNQISSRSDGTVTEGYTYDGAGRLAEVIVDAGSGPFPRSSYVYDGLGRLVIATDAGDTWSYGRDADGEVVVRTGPGGETRSFRGWTRQSGGVVSEDVAPMLTYAGAERRWHVKEVDGTTVVTSKDLGMVVGHRRQAAYGQRYVEGGSPERKAAFHGRWEEEAGLVAMGPRHVNRVDGRWLQPEPLLMEGIPQEMLGDPRGLATYRYSRNTPSSYRDQSGRTLSPLDGAMLVSDVRDTGVAAVAWGAALKRFADNPGFATYAAGTVFGIGLANAAGATIAGALMPGGGGAKAANVATRATAESVEKAVKEITGQADEVIGAVAPKTGGTTLFHGTDAASADAIVSGGIDQTAARELGGGDIFWSSTDRSVADVFAAANPSGGEPGVVGIQLAEGALERMVVSGAAEVRGSTVKVHDWDALNAAANYFRAE
jgi:RHS repeat-associated protein